MAAARVHTQVHEACQWIPYEVFMSKMEQSTGVTTDRIQALWNAIMEDDTEPQSVRKVNGIWLVKWTTATIVLTTIEHNDEDV